MLKLLENLKIAKMETEVEVIFRVTGDIEEAIITKEVILEEIRIKKAILTEVMIIKKDIRVEVMIIKEDIRVRVMIIKEDIRVRVMIIKEDILKEADTLIQEVGINAQTHPILLSMLIINSTMDRCSRAIKISESEVILRINLRLRTWSIGKKKKSEVL
jgi:ADP-glucose pyrophosphorylase